MLPKLKCSVNSRLRNGASGQKREPIVGALSQDAQGKQQWSLCKKCNAGMQGTLSRMQKHRALCHSDAEELSRGAAVRVQQEATTSSVTSGVFQSGPTPAKQQKMANFIFSTTRHDQHQQLNLAQKLHPDLLQYLMHFRTKTGPFIRTPTKHSI